MQAALKKQCCMKENSIGDFIQTVGSIFLQTRRTGKSKAQT
jgi:hypothetical protein